MVWIRWIIVLTLAGVAWTGGACQTAHANPVEIVSGQQYELCREYAENLRRQTIPDVTSSERHFLPEFTNFRQTRWEEMDPRENADLIRGHVRLIGEFPLGGGPEAVESRFRRRWPWYWEHIETDRMMLARSRFDLNHDGVSEMVYAIGMGDQYREQQLSRIRAEQHLAMPAGLFVVDEETREVDPGCFRRWLSGSAGLPFYFKGRIYLDKNYIAGVGRQRVIFETRQTSTRLGPCYWVTQVCHFTLHNSK